MKTVRIMRIKLKSVFKVVLISSVLSIGMIIVFVVICGLIYSLFTGSTGGASVSTIISQLLVSLIPYIMILFMFMLFSLFLLIAYNLLAPGLGGLEFELENNSEVTVDKGGKYPKSID